MREIEVSHQYFVDDLSGYTYSEFVEGALQTVEEYSRVAGLRVNKRKCATMGAAVEGLPLIDRTNSYKYLGIECSEDTRVDLTWDRIKVSMEKKLKQIWLSRELSLKQMVTAHNAMIIPKASYVLLNTVTSRGRYNESVKRAKDFDSNLVRILKSKQERVMNRGSNAHRLYMAKCDGGAGVNSLQLQANIDTVRLWIYMQSTPKLHPILNFLTWLDESKNKRSFVSDFRQVNANIGIRDRLEQRFPEGFNKLNLKHTCKFATSDIRDFARNRMLESWKEMPMASRVHRYEINLKESFIWQSEKHLNARAVFCNWGVQENAIQTNSTHGGNGLGCRKCRGAGINPPPRETIEHITVGCGLSHGTTHLFRHDDVLRHLINSIRRKYGARAFQYFEHIPSVQDLGNGVTLYYDMNMITTVRCNKPDIVVHDAPNKKVFVIELGISCPQVLDIQQKWKLFKYAQNSNKSYEEFRANPHDQSVGPNLRAELEYRFRATVVVIPIVIGTSGEVTDFTIGQFARLPILESERVTLLRNMQRGAAIGTHYCVKAHMARSRFGG